MEKITTHKLGYRGEDYAADYLTGLGYEIVTRNWRCKTGEIDLVAVDQNELVIVEVRTRRGENAVSQAAESITPRKQEKLTALAEIYTSENERENISGVRIDVVVVGILKDKVTLEHFREAVGW
ncbi:MAG: YraN family protein [Anaerolineae bacterium]|nr:YraN family protein [Anaerolineae bacterium]